LIQADGWQRWFQPSPNRRITATSSWMLAKSPRRRTWRSRISGSYELAMSVARPAGGGDPVDGNPQRGEQLVVPTEDHGTETIGHLANASPSDRPAS
jgi:hypothetical protein